MKDPLPFLSEIDFILIKMEAKYLTILIYKFICTTFILNVFFHKKNKKTKDLKVIRII